MDRFKSFILKTCICESHNPKYGPTFIFLFFFFVQTREINDVRSTLMINTYKFFILNRPSKGTFLFNDLLNIKDLPYQCHCGENSLKVSNNLDLQPIAAAWRKNASTFWYIKKNVPLLQFPIIQESMMKL